MHVLEDAVEISGDVRQGDVGLAVGRQARSWFFASSFRAAGSGVGVQVMPFSFLNSSAR